MKPSEALSKAIQIVERDGWIQGDHYQYSGDPALEERGKREAPCCRLGALIRAVTGTWAPVGTFRDVDERVILGADTWCRKVTGGHPVEWNDAPGRTKEEVVDMLKRAAQLAREAGE